MHSIIRTMAAAAVIGITSVSFANAAEAASVKKKPTVKCHVIKNGKKAWTTKCGATKGKTGSGGVNGTPGANGKDGANGSNGSNARRRSRLQRCQWA
jgi:hypothetical protein